MSRYNQPYSEMDEIPTETVMFLLRLIEAETDYKKSETDKAIAKAKSRGRR